MPLQSAHVFASHIGHTGKTTLSFQMSCFYAKRHPDINVLVMDLAEEGDLTKRLLGGVDSSKEKVDEVFGAVFRLLGDAEAKSSGLTSWLWAKTVDLTQHAIKVCEHNANVPPNVYLVSSGAWPRDEPEFTSEKRKQLTSKILESIEKSEETWKLFCDTDGDRRPSAFTMLAYSLCPQAIVPLHLNKADLDRTETMIGMLNDLRNRNEINTQVLMVVWNFVNCLKYEPCVHNGYSLPFTPSKVNLDILDACNARVARMAKDPELPNLFVHGGPEIADKDFLASSTAVMRQLADNVQKPAEELGMPFVEMVDQLAASGKKQMKFQSGSVEYQAKEDVIHSVDAAIRDLSDKFEAMTVDGGSK